MTEQSPDCRQMTSVTIWQSRHCCTCCWTHMVVKGQDLHVWACVKQTPAHVGTCTQTQVTHTYAHTYTHTPSTVQGPFSPSLPQWGPCLYWFPEQWRERGREMLVLLWGPITQMDGPHYICWQTIICLSPLPCVEPGCTRAPSGISMFPIQFVAAKHFRVSLWMKRTVQIKYIIIITSWMSSVDTSA